MLRPVRITPPAELPVSVREVGEHLRIDTGPEAYLLQTYIAAATDHLDGFTGILGRCLVDQVWRQDFDTFYGLRLPFPDCKNISVVWRDAAGVVTAVAAPNYFLESTSAGLDLRFVSGWSAPSLPHGGAAPVSVTFTAGYGTAQQVPFSLKQAILLMVGHSYRFREAVTDEGVAILPLAFDALTSPHRVVW